MTVFNRTCPNCNHHFSTEVHTKSYCTKKCKEQAKGRRAQQRKRQPQKRCKNCGQPKPSAKGEYCSSNPECVKLAAAKSYNQRPEHVREAAKERRKRRPQNKSPKDPLNGPKPACKGCGTTLELLHQKYCKSQQCTNLRTYEWRAKNKESVKRTRLAMKAKRREAYVEHVDPMYIYERDGWECRICGDKVNAELKYPHPQSASLDHITPISLGGKHEIRNCQTSHLVCNIRKGNRVEEDQLATA